MSLDLNVTYILVLALFLMPLLILNRIVFGPFLQLFQARHERLEGALARAEQAIAEAEVRARDFEAKIQVATNQGIDARNTIRGEAAQRMSVRVEEARKRHAAKLAEALGSVKRSELEALANVRSQSVALAEKMAAKLLGRSV